MDQTRKHGTGRGRALAIGAIVLLLAVLGSPALVEARQATPGSSAPVQAAADWLLAQQADDGSFAGFDGAPDAGATADAVIALGAAQQAGAAIDLGPALAFLEQGALVYAQTGPGQAAKLALAVAAAGGDPRDIAGVNPVALVTHSQNRETGLYGFGVFDHALIMLAMAAAEEPIPETAAEALRGTQIADGSWAFDASTADGAGDTNTTAIVIQALAATGHGDDPMVETALAYLRTVQADNGGFGYQPSATLIADANSTALVVQALIAAGEDPASDAWGDAAGALLAFQNESGAFRYTDDQPDDNFFATVQALPAIAGVAFPVLAPGGIATPAASPAAGG